MPVVSTHYESYRVRPWHLKLIERIDKLEEPTPAGKIFLEFLDDITPQEATRNGKFWTRAGISANEQTLARLKWRVFGNLIHRLHVTLTGPASPISQHTLIAPDHQTCVVCGKRYVGWNRLPIPKCPDHRPLMKSRPTISTRRVSLRNKAELGRS